MTVALTKRRIGVAIALLAVVIGLWVAAYLSIPSQVMNYGQQQLKTANHPTAEIPSGVQGSGFDATESCVAFERPAADNQVFAFHSHDPMVVAENGTYYLVIGTKNRPSLYRSRTPTEPDSWTLLDDTYLRNRFEFDSLIRVDDRYLAYGNSDVFTAESLPADDWVKGNDNTGFSDLGAYYEESTGRVHVYYEWGTAAGQSGKRIGHATSPNGVRNWTVYPTVWTAPDGYGVGDFEVVERDGLIYLFGDYDPHHPKYNVSVWVNDDPYTEFTRLDSAAVDPLPDGPANDDYGVGDPALVPIDDERYVLFANGHPDRKTPPRLHYYLGQIGNRSGSVAGSAC